MTARFSHTVRVRYAECDRMGFVHHSIYWVYFEEARTEILRKLGIVYKEIEELGFLMPVRQCSIQYHKAAVYDDLITIEVELREKPSLKWDFYYKVMRGTELLTEAYTQLFFIKKDTKKPVVLPEELMAPVFEHFLQ